MTFVQFPITFPKLPIVECVVREYFGRVGHIDLSFLTKINFFILHLLFNRDYIASHMTPANILKNQIYYRW